MGLASSSPPGRGGGLKKLFLHGRAGGGGREEQGQGEGDEGDAGALMTPIGARRVASRMARPRAPRSRIPIGAGADRCQASGGSQDLHPVKIARSNAGFCKLG